MRKILENAAITYRQEAADLAICVAPAVVLGPIAVLFGASGLIAALLTVPVLVVLYALAYAACVRASGYVLNNLAPDPGLAYQDVLASGPDLARSAAPGALLLGGIMGSALVIADLVSGWLGAGVGLLGGAAFLYWAARHAYEQPLILTHGVLWQDAASEGAQLTESGLGWTLALLAAISAPLLVAGLLSWGLAAAITAPFGVAFLAIVVALWLPLPALCLTATCRGLQE